MSELLIPPNREQIDAYEASLRNMPRIELETEHTYGPGFYARTIRLPAGTELVGKEHATEHVFLLTEGEMLLVTEEGGQHVKAPYQAVCKPGVKRAGKALTDSVCTNVHITKETDLARLEAALIVPSLALEGA